MRITPDLLADYQRDGVVVLRNLVNTDALHALVKGVDLNMSSPGP